HAEAVVLVEGSPQLDERSLGVALGEQYRAGGTSGVRPKVRRAELGRDLTQLVGRGAGGGSIAAREHDLGVSAEDARSRHRIPGLGEDPAGHRIGAVAPGLHGPPLRETGRWGDSELVRRM